jgi:pyroglutamyl-peptidase
VPEAPIEVSWKATLDEVPKLLSSQDPKYDFVLHIGLAASRTWFGLERQSFRDNYSAEDVNGLTPPQDECRELFGPCPKILKPTFDCDDVWRRWRDCVADQTADIRCSDDPGSYLCGFIYFLSMSWFWRKQTVERPVMFLHVPDLSTAKAVEQGRQVTIGLLRALAQSRSNLGVQDPLQRAVDGASIDQKDESTWAGY